jgi:hypothetical protein
MPDSLAERVRNDFARARFKAFFHRLRTALRGQEDRLLSYDEVKEKLHLGGPVYRGMQVVPIEKIVGSLNRYHQFDRAFLPLEDKVALRWENIDRAYYQEISLPPVLLYKVGEVFFVVDGHHRVSVAREKGQQFIDAEVRECQSRVNITPDLRSEDLEVLGEKVEFLDRTSLDQLRPGMTIEVTIPGGYDRMLEHIAVHRYFMGLELQRDISEREAVLHWFEKVFLPTRRVIRKSGILRSFPGKTEGDLYLWVLDRQRYLSQHGFELASPGKAASDFVDEVK